MTAINGQNLNAKAQKGATYIVPPITGVVSTSSYVAVTGAPMDLIGVENYTAWYQVTETGASNGVTVKVQMSLDGTTWFDASSISISLTGTATTAVDQAVSAGSSLIVKLTTCARFVQLLIKDTSGGSHGTVTVTGFGN